MWELDYKESWVPKNWCFWTVVLEKTLESPLDCKESQPVHPKGDQSWVFIGRSDVEAEPPILCPPDMKSWLIWKDPDAGKDWRQEEKGVTKDEIVGWHHWLDRHDFEQTSERWWRKGKPWHAIVHEWQRIGHNLTTEWWQQSAKDILLSCGLLTDWSRWQRMGWLDGITSSQSLPKLMSVESVMPSSHLILCRPLLLLPSIFPSIRVF